MNRATEIQSRMASAEVLEVRHHEVEVRTQSNIDHEFEEDEEMIAVAGCSEDLLVPGLDYEVSIFLVNSKFELLGLTFTLFEYITLFGG